MVEPDKYSIPYESMIEVQGKMKNTYKSGSAKSDKKNEKFEESDNK